MVLRANIAAPPSLNLVSELFICVSILKLGGLLFFVVILATFFSAGYNLYLYSCQQGEVVSFIGYGGVMVSSFMLRSFMCVVPVYLIFLSVFYFCLWKNSLIKSSSCGLEDGFVPFFQWLVDIFCLLVSFFLFVYF